MHICFLCHEYPPVNIGGIGAFTQSLARGLVQKGFAVSVVGLYNVEKEILEDDQGVQLYKVPKAKASKLNFIFNKKRIKKKLLKLHAEKPIDLLEGPNSANALLPNPLPFPVVMRFHGGHRYFAHTTGRKPIPIRRYLEDQAIKNSNFYCAVSKYNADAIKLLLRKPQMPIEVIYNPVDSNIFKPDDSIPIEEGLILFVGTIAEKKGVAQLMEAIPQVLDKNPKAKLWLVGRDWTNPYNGQNLRKELERKIPPQYKDRAVFKGPLPHNEIKPMLNRAQVCVFPSLMEGHPVVWLEAMACAKAIVGSNTGAAYEIITEGETGLLCNPFSPDDIARALNQMLADKEASYQMGINAREWIINTLTRETILDKNASFFQACIKQYKQKQLA
ncbi:MAG: glycosyltransferase family 4 protein [Flammeovirgaceae bacterium]